MSKGTLPVPHIIAIVLGIAILGLMGYLFFQQTGSLGRESSRQDCLLAVAQYCSFYDPNKFWDAKYGNKPTRENCADYLAGKYNACLGFKVAPVATSVEKTPAPAGKTPKPETATITVAEVVEAKKG